MARFQLSRRHALQALGATVALPWLEVMDPASAAAPQAVGGKPVRLAFIYVPYGINREGWYPKQTGADYELPHSLEPLQDLRDEFSVLSGLQHIRGQTVGHNGCLNWLTGELVMQNSPRNSVSIDQVAARHMGHYTRHPSLQIGTPLMGNTSPGISYDGLGRPLPPVRSPRALFEKLFPAEDAAGKTRRRTLYQQDRSILDLVQDQTQGLQKRLGRADAQRVDEYLEAVRGLEKRIAANEGFLDKPLPEVDRDAFQLDPADPDTMLRTYLDMIFLAFQTDQTRIISFPFSMDHDDSYLDVSLNDIAGHPAGQKGGHWHEFGHKGDERFQKVDQWCVKRLAYFLERLKKTADGDGSMLDRTLICYGGSQTRTHSMTEFPILYAGGRGLGVQHGQHHRYESGKVPFANLFVSMAQRAGLPVETFADSNTPLSGV